MLSLNPCAPKHVDQTAMRASRESFPARKGTHTVKQLQAVANFTETIKQQFGSTVVKQAPLTRKMKEGIEIPKSYRDAGNFTTPQWHAAEKKEMKGILDSESWQEIEQSLVTSDMKKKALRAHHIYDLKRSMDAKNRVVVNGKRQHESTYSETYSPTVSQTMLRLHLAVAAKRFYGVLQTDFPNAYLNSDLRDFVLIIIPDGYPNAGDVAILRKAHYGTKQGGRRFYDKIAANLRTIGLIQCPNEPCLFRYISSSGLKHVCFLILYVDDGLIIGESEAINYVCTELSKRYKCKWEAPKDYLGMDLNILDLHEA